MTWDPFGLAVLGGGTHPEGLTALTSSDWALPGIFAAGYRWVRCPAAASWLGLDRLHHVTDHPKFPPCDQLISPPPAT